MKVVIVDYGMGNLLSVRRAIERCGATPELAATPAAFATATHVVLPGVGAFGDGMKELRARGLVDAIHAHCRADRPFLGICLGMQMLFDESEEFGTHAGLALIPGKVRAIPATGADGKPHRIPHTGWNKLVPPSPGRWAGTPLEGTAPGLCAYFVHSFTAEPADPAHRLADADYDGRLISAAVSKGRVTGCQFHPEKSGEPGLKMLERFLKVVS